eukprot:354861-Chlamydomonas_euryale.AAC.24
MALVHAHAHARALAACRDACTEQVVGLGPRGEGVRKGVKKGVRKGVHANGGVSWAALRNMGSRWRAVRCRLASHVH